MEGQLADNPVAELIREIVTAESSGALRLSRERAKVAVYFDAGQLVFATSNIRLHRLYEVLKRNRLTDEQMKGVSADASDEEAAAMLLAAGILTEESLQEFRAKQVSDVVRAALLWTDGFWEFDQRVRISDTARVKVDANRLLRECARHLPLPFIKSRFKTPNEVFSIGPSNEPAKLSQTEEFIRSRARLAATAIRLPDLTGNGLPEEEGLRCAYGLLLSDLLQRSEWPTALTANSSTKPKSVKQQAAQGAEEKAGTAPRATIADVESFLARMESAKDHYEVLDVPHAASLGQIKDAYHMAARHYHPDRFHQSAADLRSRIESAFARIAQAYEVLSDPMRRADYDQKPKSSTVVGTPRTVDDSVVQPRANAENSFRQGMEALKNEQYDEAIRFLAEAAILEPKRARYRANYGYALMNRPKARRAAENEILAALAIEPDNSKFRVMLAELYQQGGMRRRAETEATRALNIDPKNEKARALLDTIRKK